MILKKAFSYFTFSVLGAVLNLLTVMYLTRVLSPEEYGYIGLFTAILFFVTPLIGFRGEELVSINKASLGKDAYIHYLNVFISFSLIIFIVLVFLFSSISYIFFNNYFLLVVLTLFIGLCRYFINIHSSELIQNQKSKIYGILNLSSIFFTLLVTIIVTYFFKMSWEGRLLAILCVEMVFVFYRLVKLSDIYNEFHFDLDKVEIKKIITFGAPLFVALGLSWIIFESDKIIVLKFFDLATVGYYAVAYSIGAFLNYINQSVTNAIVPIVYNQLSLNKGKVIVQKYNLYYSSFIFIFALISSILLYVFTPILFGEEYAQSNQIISLVVLAFAFHGIYRTSGIVINFYKLNVLKTKILFYGALANLILSISLIPFLGILAPVVGTIASFVILAWLSYFYSNKELIRRGVTA